MTLARRPALYESIGIADTPEGRYEALVLYLFLVLERMKAEGALAVEQSQALLEAFGRMEEHLAANEVDLSRPGPIWGCS